MQKNFDEMSTYFFEEMIEVNADNKALISFNETAVDRRIQPNRLCTDELHLPMHDYPQPEHCIPSGYMVRTPKKFGDEIQYYEDDLDRNRIVANSSGPSYYFLRSSHFYVSNIQTHINDLLEIRSLYPKKGAMGLYVDCGSDWEFHQRAGKSSLVNIYEYGRFWLASKLSVFFVASYIPENHHQGPIEHSFAPRTNDIAGVTFPLDLKGKNKDSEIAEEINSSLNLIANAWNGKEYGGFPVVAEVVECNIEQRFDDYSLVYSELKTGNLPDEMKSRLSFFLSHLVKTQWTLLFIPCFNCDVCLSTMWVQAPKFYDFVARVHNGKLPLGKFNDGMHLFLCLDIMSLNPDLLII
jgi:hypothetical protein